MKSTILLLALSAIILGGCTTAYKTGQTPDDVYFSPERPQEEYVRAEKEDDKYYGSDNYYEDRYLRMKVHNRTRWSDLDDLYYYNNRYNYSYYNYQYWNNPWSPYNYWNHYYNPYSPSVIIINPKTNTTYNRPRTFNLNTYNNNGLTNNDYTNPKAGNSKNGLRTFNGNSNNNNRNTNTNRDAGTFLRDIFGGSNSSSTNNNSGNAPTRSNNNTNSSSSSESKSTGSGSECTSQKVLNQAYDRPEKVNSGI